MYSKVKIAGHAIHPMLVHFPIVFYTTAFLAYVACALGADPLFFQIGMYANVAGVATAVLAALPGFIDWSLGVPTGSPAKATGLSHMLFNVAALLAFAVVAFLYWGNRFDALPPLGVPIGLTFVGLALTVIGGVLGHRMVQKHHVGIELTPDQQRHEPRVTPAGEGSRGVTGAGPGPRPA